MPVESVNTDKIKRMVNTENVDKIITVAFILLVHYLTVCRITEVISFVCCKAGDDFIKQISTGITVTLCTSIILNVWLKTLIIIATEIIKNKVTVVVMNSSGGKENKESDKEEATDSTKEDNQKL